MVIISTTVPEKALTEYHRSSRNEAIRYFVRIYMKRLHQHPNPVTPSTTPSTTPTTASTSACSEANLPFSILQAMFFLKRLTTFIPPITQSIRTSAFTPTISLSFAQHTHNTPPQLTRFSSPCAVIRPPSSKPTEPTPLPSDALREIPPHPPLPPDDDEDDLDFMEEGEETYRLPPPEIARLVDAVADPTVSLQPASKEWIVLLHRPSLPPIAEVAAEELRLAGFRINANTYAPSRTDYYIGMAMQRVDDPQRTELFVTGLPPPVGDSPYLELGFLRWSPDGKRFAFCKYDPLFGLELWIVEADTRRASCLLPGVRLNAVCGEPFTWNSDSKAIIAKFVIEDRPVPGRHSVPRGPIVQENFSTKPAPSRTFQDLLQSRHDRRLFEHYTTCQLGIVDVETGSLRKIGAPAAFRGASPSPNGEYLLTDAMVPPFPYMMPAGRFPRRVEVWHTHSGEVACIVANIPLQDKIPIAFDGVGEGPRGIGWRSDVPAMLYWAEAQDGGDPNREAEVRDHLYTLSAPFIGAPRRLASLPWRYGSIMWGSDSVALLSERRYKTRSSRSYLLAPGPADASGVPDMGDFASNGGNPLALGPCCARACDLSQSEAPKRLLFDIPNWEDRYNDPGSVCTVRHESGKSVLKLIYPSGRGKETDSGGVGRPFLMLHGSGASEDGDRPDMSLMDTVCGTKTLLWQSSPPNFESVAIILKEEEETGAPTELLIRREAQKTNPNFFVVDVTKESESAFSKISESSGEVKARADLHSGLHSTLAVRPLTDFPHPAPELIDVQREMVWYERADGLRLQASLYLPPGYKAERDGPLPVFMWAYPREYKSAEFAGQTRGSPYRFVRLARTPLYWLTRGYAILDGPEMAIVGEGETEANDSYVEQLVMSAEAAVKFVEERGIGERGRIAIGGHSYGAFMTVNLLAHAPHLFCCGIARSGAYNRTLTPFGFQSEERTLWEARNVYQRMSPYMFANQIESPLLLVHGDADNNPGTFPMQSERLFQAMKGHGKVCRYVNLPHEGHGYRARESVMTVLAEMTTWLDRYCKLEGDL